MQLWTSVEALTSFQETHLLQIPLRPTSRLCLQWAFGLLTQPMLAILVFPGVGERQGVYFAKCVLYIKGMLLHISLMWGGGM